MSKNTSCINDINETDEEECIMEFFDGENHMPLRQGETVIMSFSL